MARLRIVGEAVDQLVELHEQKVQIGRGRDNDVVLPDAQKGVSRVHAELRYENGRYVIVDLQSQNGTWVNGRRVDRAEVPVGSEIALGEYRLTLEEEPIPSRDRPTVVAQTRPVAFDELRMRPPHDEAPAAPMAPPETAKSGSSWAIGAAVAGIAVVILAGMAWVSSSRAPQANTSRGPAAAPATPPGPEPAAPAAAAAPEPAHATSDPPESAGVSRPAAQASGVARVARKPGESSEAWRARAAAIQTRYGYSKAALQRGDYAAAAGGFEAILVDEPGYLDAPQLLVEAQSGLRASARSLFRAGARLDAAGDWVGALQKYEQARQIYAGIPELADSLQRVRGKLREAGTSAFNHARQLEAAGHAQDAVKEYEKAIQWLPPDDPNRHIAQARIEQLRRN